MITPRPRETPRRLPERKAVTIAAGFRFDQGLVLCADTQETVGQSKVSCPKLVVGPTQKIGNDSPDDLMMAVAGAGDGPFIDKLIEEVWIELSVVDSFGQACERLGQTIKTVHEEYGKIFQTGYMPTAELICGIKMNGQSKLFQSGGPVVVEKSQHASVGVGGYMANFLASRMHYATLSKQQCSILAAYILFQCKEHVDGCGGESHIAVLDIKGGSSRFDPLHAARVSEQLDVTDVILGALLINSPSDLTDHSFKLAVDRSMERVYRIREESRKRRPDYDAMYGRLEAEDLEQAVKREIFPLLKKMREQDKDE